MAFKNSLKVLFGKGFFLLRGPCASFLARLPKPAWPASPPAARLVRLPRWPTLPRPSPAPRAGPSPARRAVPLLVAAPRHDRGRKLPPRGDHVPASPAARQPRPGTAPTRPPSPAGARALAHSRPHFLSSTPEPSARAPPSPRPQLRRRRAPAPPRHSSIARARNSASPSFDSRSRLRRLPSPG